MSQEMAVPPHITNFSPPRNLALVALGPHSLVLSFIHSFIHSFFHSHLSIRKLLCMLPTSALHWLCARRGARKHVTCHCHFIVTVVSLSPSLLQHNFDPQAKFTSLEVIWWEGYFQGLDYTVGAAHVRALCLAHGRHFCLLNECTHPCAPNP